MPLKVLHLSTYAGGGGAARAAANVNGALQRAGVDSRMVTANGTRFKIARAADRALWRLQRSPAETWRSPARFGSLQAKVINESPEDIVNLHWVTDGFLSIEEIGKINKPVVMSMYDMWPICGTEHYGLTTHDARWRTGYSRRNRPQNEAGVDMDRRAWRRKRAHWNRFRMIPASSWLEEATLNSALCSSWPTMRIPHPTDESVFRPMDRTYARNFLGVDFSRPTIGFVSSAGIHDQRKGFDLLQEAIHIVQSLVPDIQVLVVGPRPTNSQIPGLPSMHFLGSIGTDEVLALAYNAMDVLAVPSREDNLPLTAMEAQLCERPVVAFRVGGLVDLIHHQTTGYLASPLDAKDLAHGLLESIDDARTSNGWGQSARQFGITQWGFRSVAARYRKLYDEILQSRRL